MDKVSKFNVTCNKKLICIFIAIMSIAFLPSIKVKAQSITRLSYKDKHYYLTERQLSKIDKMESNLDYAGINQYLDSLGEDVFYYAIEDGVLYCADPMMTEATIPDEIHTIDTNAFQGNIMLERVTMPDSVVTIGYGAFAKCENLTSIRLSKNLKEIGDLAFYGCTSLVNVKILGNVTEFGEQCFDGCTSLENIITTKGSQAEKYARNNLNCAVTYTSKPTFEKNSLVILKGDTYSTKVYNSGDNKVTYSTSNSKVVRVDKDGTIHGISSGTATVYAKIDGTTLKCKITVRNKSMNERIYQFKKNYTTSSMSDYEIIELAHAWLIKNVKYDNANYLKGTVPEVSHTAKGALLNGVAVCDGYSYAFKMIMNSFNIPCKVITGYSGGVGHAWNLVKINNQWYHIDVTYDDPIVNGRDDNYKVYTDYFLINDKQMKKNHTWNTNDFVKCTATKIDKTYASERK